MAAYFALVLTILGVLLEQLPAQLLGLGDLCPGCYIRVNAETRNMATGVHDGRDTIVRTMLALTGIATAGLLATGLSIATPAYAASIPADCTVQYGGTTPSMTCTARPAKQVWNLQITCRVETAGGLWVPVQGSKVTGDGTSKVAYCFDPGTATFIIDS